MLIEMIGDDEMEGKVSTNQNSTIGFILECQESHIAIRHNSFELSGQGHDHSISIHRASLVRCSEWLYGSIIDQKTVATLR